MWIIWIIILMEIKINLMKIDNMDNMEMLMGMVMVIILILMRLKLNLKYFRLVRYLYNLVCKIIVNKNILV